MKKFVIWTIVLVMTICSLGTVSYASVNNGVAVFVDGVYQDFTAVVKDGVPFLPMAESFSAVGITDAEYSSANHTGTATCCEGTIEITAGKDSVEVNLISIELSAAAYEDSGRLMIPAELIETGFNGGYSYDRTQNKIYLTKPVKTEPDSSMSMDEYYQSLMDNAKEENRILKEDPEGLDCTLQRGYVSSDGVSDECVEITDATDDSITKYGVKISVEAEAEETYDLQWCCGANGFPGGENDVLRNFDPGDVGLVSFWAKALDWSGNEAGAAQTRFYVDGASPHDCVSIGAENFMIGEEWHRYYLPIYLEDNGVNTSYLTTEFRIVFDLGFYKQTIVVASMQAYKLEGVTLADLVSDPTIYEGMNDDALWRKEALRRIEKYRKNDMTIEVRNSSGNPVPGAEIQADMTKNEFLFGTAVENYGINSQDDEIGRKYTELLLENFNTITVGRAKWLDTGEDDGADAIRLANWAYENGLNFRGHTAYWEVEGIMPKYLNGKIAGMDYSDIYDLYTKRIYECMLPFKGKAAQWDIINEITYQKSLVWDPHGVEIYADMYKLAHQIDPECKLYINETGYYGDRALNSVNAFKNKIKSLQDLGADIDGVGIQAHYLKAIYPQKVYNELESLSEYTDEFSITEYDLDPVDEAVSAPFLRDMLILTYSHPKAAGFIMWGFADKLHWKSNAPLYDGDFNPKPALEEWQKLVKHEWMSHESGVTDSSGKCVLRGHRGDYSVKVTVGGNTIEVPFRLVKEGLNTITVTVDGNNLSAQVSHTPDSNPSRIEENTYSEILNKSAYPQLNTFHKEDTILADNYEESFKSSVISVSRYSSDTEWQKGESWGTLKSARTAFENMVDDTDGIKFHRIGSQASTASFAKRVWPEGLYGNEELNFDFIFDRKSLDGNENIELNLYTDCSTDSSGLKRKILYSISSSDGKATECFFGTEKTHSGFRLERDLAGVQSQTEKMSISLIPRETGGYTGKVKITSLDGTVLYEGQCDYTINVESSVTMASLLEGTDMLRWEFKQSDSNLDKDIFCIKEFSISLTDQQQPEFAIEDISRINESFCDFSLPQEVSQQGETYDWTLKLDGNETVAKSLITPISDRLTINSGDINENGGEVRCYLSKRFTPVQCGENLIFSSDIYFDNRWGDYTHYADFAVSLTSSTNDEVNINLIKRGGGEQGTALYSKGASKLFGDYTLREEPYQLQNQIWYRLFAILRSNDEGGYDLQIILSNMGEGEKMQYICENVISLDDAMKLDGVCISARTNASVTDSIPLVSIRNLKLKTGDASNMLRQGYNEITVSVDNRSDKITDVAVIGTQHKDELLSNISLKNKAIEANEKLTVKIGLIDDADTKNALYVFDSLVNMIPKTLAMKFGVEN